MEPRMSHVTLSFMIVACITVIFHLYLYLNLLFIHRSVWDRASTRPSCQWRFRSYYPGTFERAWSTEEHDVLENVCERLAQEPFKTFVRDYMTFVLEGNASACQDIGIEFPVPQQYSREVFSRFEYGMYCGSESSPRQTVDVFIEPLAGLLRHPLGCLNKKYMGRKDYIIIDPWAAHNLMLPVASNPLIPRKFFYFDLGASVWLKGPGGASQSWFHKAYENICVHFDHIYAWEMKVEPPSYVFQQIPGPIKAKYHWFNIPASTSVGDWDNPLTIILSETRPEDFVLLKVDIDNWVLEEQLIAQIRASPAIQSRIDEMFWEHHADFYPMKRIWKKQVHTGLYLNDSIALFRDMRKQGIRVHSWV